MNDKEIDKIVKEEFDGDFQEFLDNEYGSCIESQAKQYVPIEIPVKDVVDILEGDYTKEEILKYLDQLKNQDFEAYMDDNYACLIEFKDGTELVM
jgi:hypothetical protein